MLPIDWMSASRDAHCLVGFSLKSARKREGICRHHRDLQTVSGIKLTWRTQYRDNRHDINTVMMTVNLQELWRLLVVCRLIPVLGREDIHVCLKIDTILT